MRSTMEYRGSSYGNSDNAPNYAVKLSRSDRDAISISFVFDSPAAGRGVGDAKGSVRNISLEIPAETAHALSHALLLSLSQTASCGTEFRIEEGRNA